MRFLTHISASLLLVAALGCGEHRDATYTDTSATGSSDTSGTLITDSSATTTGSTGGGVSAMSPSDKEFVMKAGQGGMAEVQLGQMAGTKASSAEVKAFAQRMVTDHSAANEELKQLATIKGLALPTDVAETHKQAATHLNGLSGAAFDKAYMQHMVEDHQKDVQEFQNASANATDAD